MTCGIFLAVSRFANAGRTGNENQFLHFLTPYSL
jgi:hypothetical protein